MASMNQEGDRSSILDARLLIIGIYYSESLKNKKKINEEEHISSVPADTKSSLKTMPVFLSIFSLRRILSTD